MRFLIGVALVVAGVVVGGIGIGPAGAQNTCTELGGAVDDGLCRGHATNDVYTLEFSFPVGYPDEQALTDYLTQVRDGFVNVAETPGSRGLPYELDAEGTPYRSGITPEGTQSVVFKVFQDVGGLHPQTWFKAFNFDLTKRAPITYETLFSPDSKPLEVIFPVVEAELQKQTGLDEPLLPGAGLDPSHYQNFALTDDALIFFFGQGELLPEVAGARQVAVPRGVVGPVLAL